jgi:hypothetical protein
MSADAFGTLACIPQRARPFARFVSGRHRATGFRFTFDKHDFVGRRIPRHQTWERELTAWIDTWLDAVATPGLFVDIGANIGWFSLMASRHPRVTKVDAFEPDSVNGFLLDMNVRNNGLDAAITTVGCALGDARGVARLQLAGAARALRRTQCVVVELSRTFSVPAGLDFAGMVDALRELGIEPVFSDHENPVPGFATRCAQDRRTNVAFVRPAASMAGHAAVRC